MIDPLLGQLGWTGRMPVECSAHPCPQEALRDCISTLKSSGQLELTTSSLNTNSGIREILLPGSGPLTAHRHCSSGPGHCPTLSLWKGDHTRGLVTWDVPARISDKSLPWFGSRKTLSLQASCSLLPSTQRAWRAGSCLPPWTKAMCHQFASGVRGVAPWG